MARRVAKPVKVVGWQITRIDGKRAFQIGQLQAPDAATAIKLAIRKFDIEPERQSRIAARPIVMAR